MRVIRDLELMLISAWKELLPTSGIDRDTHFFEAGGDSLAATLLNLQIERETGRAVPTGQIFVTPVLKDLAAVLAGKDGKDGAPLVVPLVRGGEQRPLFGIAPARGGLFHFRSLATAVCGNWPLIVIEPRVSAAGTHSYRSIRDLAEQMVAVMRQRQAQGPYRMAGYSFGGVLAYEMARVLEANGERSDLLILIDSSIRGIEQTRPQPQGWWNSLRHNWHFLRECRHTRIEMGQPFRYKYWAPLIWQKLRNKIKSIRVAAGVAGQSGPVKPGAAELEVEVQSNLLAGYDPGEYTGPVHLLRAQRQLTLRREWDYDLGWSRFVRGEALRIITIPGDHFGMMAGSGAEPTARCLNELVESSERDYALAVEREVAAAQAVAPLPFAEPVNGEDLMERFALVAQTYSQLVALRDGGKRLRYAELYELSVQVASFLAERCQSDEKPVLLLLPTGWQIICTILGVLLSGRSYLPIDGQLPPARVAAIAASAGCTLGICLNRNRIPEVLDNAGLTWYSFAEICAHRRQLEQYERPVISPTAAAITLFTSGSTGTPKGSTVSRGMLLHECWRRWQALGLSPRDRYGLFYSCATMGGTSAIVPVLFCGGCLCVYRLRERGLSELPGWIQTERLTVVHMVTTLMRRLLSSIAGTTQTWTDLRLLIPGGERCRPSDIDLWKRTCAPSVKWVPCLGSTECATIAMHPIGPEFSPSDGPLPVGRPFAALDARIVREDGTEAAIGMEGELVLTSHYIFRGYLNGHSTNEANVRVTPDGRTVYRTGDFGYLDADGVFYNLGRRDSRVKINGQLVELLEVESLLLRSNLLVEAAVVFRPVSEGTEERILVAFCKSNADFRDVSQLREFLLAHLPPVMLPMRWVMLPELPQTANGKVDRLKLANMPLG